MADGALSILTGDLSDSPYGDEMYARSNPSDAGSGNDDAIAGALSRANKLFGDPEQEIGALSRAQKSASQGQIDAIEAARKLVANSMPGQGSVNLPLLSVASGLLSPTRYGSIGEAIGNATRSAIPAIQQQREVERQNAMTQAQLGIQESAVPANLAEQQLKNYQTRLGIADKLQNAATTAQFRQAIAKNAADARVQAAQIGAQSKITAADIAADKARYDVVPGTMADPNDPTKQIQVTMIKDKRAGTFDIHPGVTPISPQAASIAALAPALDTQAQAIANYKVAPPSNYGGTTPAGIALKAAVLKANPDYDVTQFAPRSKTVNNFFGTGPLGNQTRFLNTSVAHLGTMSDLSDALDNGDVQIINAAKNRFAKEFGYPAPTNFDAAKQIVGQEVTKAIVANGGSANERDEAGRSISNAGSPAQLKGVIDTYKTLLGGQLNGLRRQYEVGSKLKNFDELLSPEVSDLTRKLQASPQAVTGFALPPDPKELKPGITYKTSKGMGTWDGTQFLPVTP